MLDAILRRLFRTLLVNVALRMVAHYIRSWTRRH